MADQFPRHVLEREHAEMDAEIARLRAQVEAWTETAAQHARNESFYRDLIVEIGNLYGVAARTSDDGSVQEDVLALRVPELVRQTLAQVEALREGLRPFADYAKVFEHRSDRTPMAETSYSQTMGDCRRAAALLDTKAGGE